MDFSVSYKALSLCSVQSWVRPTPAFNFVPTDLLRELKLFSLSSAVVGLLIHRKVVAKAFLSVCLSVCSHTHTHQYKHVSLAYKFFIARMNQIDNKVGFEVFAAVIPKKVVF